MVIVMADRVVCACAVLLACLLGASQGEIETILTKSLIGLYLNDYQAKLPDMYISDGQCNAYIDPATINVCNKVVSSLTVLVQDEMPPNINIDLLLTNYPMWAIKIYRTTGFCKGEANVTVSVTCQI